MKTLRLIAVGVAFSISGLAYPQDLNLRPGGSLGSGANIGQSIGNLGSSTLSGGSPFSKGLGQIVSGWTQQGIRGPDLADRIHWLQAMRAEEIAERMRRLDPDRFSRDRDIRDRDDRFRDRDRDDHARDRDRDNRFRDRDRDDRARDRDRDDRFRDRDRDDRGRDRDRDDRFRDRDRDDRARDRDRDDRTRDRDRDDHVRDRDRDDRTRDRDRDDHARDRDRDDRFRDRDPRQDRGERRGDRGESARRDREDQGRLERAHNSRTVEKNDDGKHVGALGGKKESQPVHVDAHKADVKGHAPDTRSVQPSGGPLQKLKDAVPSFTGRGKGKG